MAAANNGGGSTRTTTTSATDQDLELKIRTCSEVFQGLCDDYLRVVKRPRTTTHPPSSSSLQPPHHHDSNNNNLEGEEDEDQESEEEGDGNVDGEDEDVVGEEEEEESDRGSDGNGETEIGEEEVQERGAERGGGGGGDEFVFFMKDADVLDCPICTDPLSIPVYQCGNGHVACSSCCLKIKNKCPSCSQSIGHSRCRAIEKVVESVQVSCRNLNYGCNERMFYNKKNEHELMCIYEPCSCPTPGCDYIGSSYGLYHHYTTKHREEFKTFIFDSPFHVCLTKKVKHVILVDKNEVEIFVVNHARTVHGSLVNIDCIKCSGSERRYLYSLSNVNGDNSMVFKAFAENVPDWVEHVPRGSSLMVARDSSVACDNLAIEVCIKKDMVLPGTSWRKP